jgi:hypothetical protein
MTTLQMELEDELEYEEYDDSDLEVTDEVTYEDDEDDSQPRARGDVSGQLQAELTAAVKEIETLKTRLGDALRKGGERLKKKDEEIEEWLENIQRWQESELERVHHEAFEEGQKAVERALFPRLMSEDKAAYLEEVRLSPVKPSPASSPRPVQPLDTRRRSSSSDADEEAIHEMIEHFTAQGVPVDKLEQTSATAVVSSGTKYLAGQVASLAEKVSDIDSKLDSRNREASGATRVSSGASSSARPVRLNDEKRLEQIESELKRLRGRGSMERAAPLLRERAAIRQRLARQPR